VDIDSYSDYFFRDFVICQKTFLRALCGFFVPFVVLSFLLQSWRKGRKGVSVSITHLIPYFNKGTVVFLSASSNFFLIFLEPLFNFFASWRLGVKYFIFLQLSNFIVSRGMPL